MNTLFLKIRGASKLNASILINNKPVKLKKNTYGGHEVNYDTSASSVNIKICKYLEINNRLWWFFSWLFYIISIFGILEPKYDKNCIVVNAEFDIKLNSQITEVIMSVNNLSGDSKAINVETSTQYVEHSNYFYIDHTAKKRLKIMKAVKWLTFLSLIIIGVIFILKLI